MTLKERIDQDLKSAMLGGDKPKVSVLRGIKSAILYVEVAKGNRDVGLSDEEIQSVLAKESKKRQESAQLYIQGKSQDRADQEMNEKAVIDGYLPAKISDEDLAKIVDEAIAATGASTAQDMGKVMGVVKAKVGTSADGALIAQLVKSKLAV